MMTLSQSQVDRVVKSFTEAQRVELGRQVCNAQLSPATLKTIADDFTRKSGHKFTPADIEAILLQVMLSVVSA